jgi:hypothetical protein
MDQARVFIEAASLARQLGLPRKEAFFINQSAQCVAQIGSFPVAHDLTRRAAELYGATEDEATGASDGWLSMKLRLLEDLMTLSGKLGDSQLSTTYHTSMLSLIAKAKSLTT